MFKKILIANRGEIAVRIIRSCKELGIKTVAIYSIADNNSMHVKMADESICIGGIKSSESYLNIPAILTAAELTGAEAIHPGYGFLSENYKFARVLEEHNITFIGPKSEHIKIMGDKVSARTVIRKTGIPLVPGSKGPVKNIKELKKVSKEIGLPIIIKAAAGGGGKGMKVVEDESDLENAYNLTRSEAEVNFGNDEIYVEKFLRNPKHIEFQIFADNFQNVIHLGERDCSIQRRHQKLIEEAPAYEIDQEEKEKLLNVIIKAMKDIKYRGAGTIEMLYEGEKFYFIEEPFKRSLKSYQKLSELSKVKIAMGEHIYDHRIFLEWKKKNLISFFQPDSNLLLFDELKFISDKMNKSQLIIHNWCNQINLCSNLSFALSLNKPLMIEKNILENPYNKYFNVYNFDIKKGKLSFKNNLGLGVE